MKTNLTHLNNTNPYTIGNAINQPSLLTDADITSIITSNNSGKWVPMDSPTEPNITLSDEKGTKKITAEYLRQIERNSVSIFLRLLVFEGKFTKEETANIKNMLESNDEASKELACVILKNEGYEYIL
jgi:hypothetical protein